MKKIITIITMLVLLNISCASDDNSNSDNTEEVSKTEITGLWIDEGESETYYRNSWTFNNDMTGIWTDTETRNDPNPYSENFTWSENNNTYTLIYEGQGTNGSNDRYTIGKSGNNFVLLDENGKTIATKE